MSFREKSPREKCPREKGLLGRNVRIPKFCNGLLAFLTCLVGILSKQNVEGLQITFEMNF